jgi:hypothetical protein
MSFPGLVLAGLYRLECWIASGGVGEVWRRWRWRKLAASASAAEVVKSGQDFPDLRHRG